MTSSPGRVLFSAAAWVFGVVTKNRSKKAKQLIFMANLNRKFPFIISRPRGFRSRARRLRIRRRRFDPPRRGDIIVHANFRRR